MGYKITCATDGKYLKLLYVDPANKHDLTIIKDRKEDFIHEFKGNTVILDKAYIDKDFEKEMKNRGIEYITIKRENMIRSNDEKEYYKFLSKLRRIIETIFLKIENLGLRFIRAISRRGLAIKIILSIIAFNILQMMRGF